MSRRPTLKIGSIVFSSCFVTILAVDAANGYLQYAPVNRIVDAAFLSTVFSLIPVTCSYLWYRRSTLRNPLAAWRGAASRVRVLGVAVVLLLAVVGSGIVVQEAATTPATEENVLGSSDIGTVTIQGPTVEAQMKDCGPETCTANVSVQDWNGIGAVVVGQGADQTDRVYLTPENPHGTVELNKSDDFWNSIVVRVPIVDSTTPNQLSGYEQANLQQGEPVMITVSVTFAVEGGEDESVGENTSDGIWT